VQPEELVTHIYPLADWYAGFEMAATRSEALRVVIKP
jgi:threonine dehydrogenase-like Zn-dependent dehydrogenase